MQSILLSNSCGKFNSKSKFPISILQSSNIVMSTLLTGSLFAHLFLGRRSVLLCRGSVCTAKRNKPDVHNDYTVHEVSLLKVIFEQNRYKLFSKLHNSNSFIILIAEIAVKHFNTITQVNHRFANYGTVGFADPDPQNFCFYRTVLASDL